MFQYHLTPQKRAACFYRSRVRSLVDQILYFCDWSIAGEEPACSKSFLINHFLSSDFLLQSTFSFRHFSRTWLLGQDNSFYFFYLFVLSYLVFYFTIKSPILAVKRPNTTQSNNWYKLVYSSRLITPRVEKGCKTWKVLKSFTLPRKQGNDTERCVCKMICHPKNHQKMENKKG